MGKRIKVLYTIPNFDTAGSGKVVYDLVNGLNKTSFEPEICCFHNRGEYFKVIQSLGVKIHLFQFATPYRPFLSFPFRLCKIYRFFKKNQFDIIYSWHWSSDFSEPLAAKLAGIPFVYTKKAMGWGNKAWRWRSQLSTKIIAINSDMVKGFLKPYKTKVEYIPLGVDIDYFKPIKKKYNDVEGNEILKEDFVIVSVANLVPVKGIEIVLEAVKQINNRQIKVFVVGDDTNNYGKELKSKYKNLINVFFLGKKLDVRQYLAIADVFVIPTKDEGRKEGMPIAPLEAMASGRIVIGSNIPGIRDILKSDLLFRPGSINDLISKINFVRDLSPKQRTNLEFEMRNNVVSRFSLKHFLKGHENLYNSLLK